MQTWKIYTYEEAQKKWTGIVLNHAKNLKKELSKIGELQSKEVARV